MSALYNLMMLKTSCGLESKLNIKKLASIWKFYIFLFSKICFLKYTRNIYFGANFADDEQFFSSPEHEVLMLSYCGQSMSVEHRPSYVVQCQQLL